MTTCPITVSDYVAANCTCHPSYTHASNFKESYNCVEPKGLKQIVSILEMVILCVDLAYAGIVTLFYLKVWNALKNWGEVECCRRAGDTGTARQMTVFLASSLIALLALAEKAVVYATSSDNPAVGLLVTIGFSVQVGFEWRYMELLQMGIVAKEKAEGRTEYCLKMSKGFVVGLSSLATATLIALQFADLRLESRDKWIDAYVVYGTVGGLAILLSVVLIAYINTIFVQITSLLSLPSSGGQSYEPTMKRFVNNMMFLSLRVVILVILLVLLGIGPGQNHSTLLPAHFAWFASTLIFVHLLQAYSLEWILSH